MGKTPEVETSKQLEACRALLRWFCDRVDLGRVRSVRTAVVFGLALVGKYREALDMARRIGPDVPEVF